MTIYKSKAYLYDILDWPYEYLYYKKWRPKLLSDLSGKVLEAGVGTGRNLAFYPCSVQLTAIDKSQAMIEKAAKRLKQAKCSVNLLQQDICQMNDIKSNNYDWVISTFLFCVLPNHLQAQALTEIARVLKSGGKFKIVEIVYSKNSKIRARQRFIAKYVENIFGARFDRNTIEELERNHSLKITQTSYLKDDTYLLIEGYKV